MPLPQAARPRKLMGTQIHDTLRSYVLSNA